MSISEEPVSADNGDAADRVAAEDADWGDGQWVASWTALQGFISLMNMMLGPNPVKIGTTLRSCLLTTDILLKTK